MQRRPSRARAAGALRNLMAATGLNNRETAKLAEVHESTIGRWTKGEIAPDPRNADHLAAKIRERYPDLAAAADDFYDAVMRPADLEVTPRLGKLITAVNDEIAAAPAEDREDLTEEVRRRIGLPSDYAAARNAESAE